MYAFIKLNNKGVSLSIRVKLKTSKTGPYRFSISDSSLNWGVNSAPVENQANEELLNSIADFFSLRKNQISIIGGQKNRNKTILLENTETEFVLQRLNKLVDVS